MDKVSVIVASFGDRTYWDKLADRAIRSVWDQTRLPDSIHRVHGPTLHDARNEGAHISDSDYLIFLDCDDMLEPDYVAKMMESPSPQELRYPAVRYVNEYHLKNNILPEPTVIPPRPLETGNFIVIGALIPRTVFFSANGWRDIPVYEDWDLWLRVTALGCRPVLVQDAIYRAYVRPQSRNIVGTSLLTCQEILNYNREWKKGIIL